MPTLTESIKRLYEVFSDVPKPKHIDGCPCCIDDKDIGILLGKELRLIAPSELSSYASSAFLTVGDIEDYLYFLPRILEVLATDDSWWPDPEVTGRAIRSAHPESWSSDRQRALEELLHAVILHSIETGNYSRIDDWLCAIAKIGLDVRPFLEVVAKYPAAVLGSV